MNTSVIPAFLGRDQRTPYAKRFLEAAGLTVVPPGDPGCTHLILPYPWNRGGPDPAELRTYLHPGLSVLGGQIGDLLPELHAGGCTVTDYAADETFLLENARITAEAAAVLLGNSLPVTLHACPVLVTGWGRIAKELVQILGRLGAHITVAARKDTARQEAEALGVRAISTAEMTDLSRFRAIVNTVPAPLFHAEDLMKIREDSVLLELASAPGGFGDCPGRTVIHASGLPARYAPESAGIALGKCLLRAMEGGSK